MDPTRFIGNPLILAPNRPYGAIVGAAPSRGARSPILWRAAFAELGMAADFHPFDVSETNLQNLFDALRRDARFLGGAIAVPFKERIPLLVDSVAAEAVSIGAVNALYRISGDKLGATNTDGLAAVAALVGLIGSVKGSRILCLGTGGAGKAVAASLAVAGAQVALWNRTVESARKFAERLGRNALHADLEPILDSLATVDVLVNCTSAGFVADSAETNSMPIARSLLSTLRADAIVFDVIYQPPETALLKAARERGLCTLNGKSMNLEQAVIAFCRAVPQADETRVRRAMAAV